MKRRKFIHTTGCAALGSTTLLSSLLNLTAVGKAAQLEDDEDYRALVCILLAGGNDSYNMLIPRGSAEYMEYLDVRQNLAINQSEILPLINADNNNRTLGLHPAMTNLQRLYDEQKVAFIANVGSLIEPVDKDGYTNGTSKLPLGLFSHVDQIAHWQTSIPQSRISSGWGGRMGDLLESKNGNQKIALNITLSGNNLYQSGINTRPFTLSTLGPECLHGYQEEGFFNELRTQAVDSLLSHEYANHFENTYRNIVDRSVDANVLYEEALAQLVPLQTTFSSHNETAQQLKVIAETISLRQELNLDKQIFFVQFGGWDHHDEVLNNHNKNLIRLDQALGEFQSALEELNISDKVTTFTISDFGRTLTSNGNGTDHGWGGNCFTMGGSVQGGIYGTYPDLYLDNPLDIGRGRLIPTTSADLYFAELALWFGVSRSNLDAVLPNIHTFYDVITGGDPIGFLSKA